MNRRDMARVLGRTGGRIRAERLSAARKTAIASLGGSARALSLTAARRIEDNFRYLTAVRSLQRPSRTASTRQRRNDRLPGVYPRRK